ncbi:creatininase family protein [Sphingomonas hylomeconis]|uniref:Creatininase family protein n=1 Tax=Sphingomonas hylomeconis TaxID=1395958 RepID=A0ABV7SXH4_9SPHN|nr:creatininase family protein [Sphingomonas hylomeconis]
MTARRHALQDLSWVDLEELRAEGPVIVLPLGSQEQQGPHAPMGDFVVAERIALAAAERADAICAPVLPFGYAEFFRGIAGGMQLRAETFRLVLSDMIGAFTDHGFRHIVILNGHTTNAPLIADVAHEVRRATGLFVPNLNLWRLAPDAVWQRLHGENAAAARGHGADPLTSVTMHLTPDLIRADRIAPAARRTAFGLPTQGQFASVMFGSAPVELPLDVTDVAANGVGNGDARFASAAIGAELVEWTTDHVASFLRHFRRCDPTDPAAAPAA